MKTSFSNKLTRNLCVVLVRMEPETIHEHGDILLTGIEGANVLETLRNRGLVQRLGRNGRWHSYRLTALGESFRANLLNLGVSTEIS